MVMQTTARRTPLRLARCCAVLAVSLMLAGCREPRTIRLDLCLDDSGSTVQARSDTALLQAATSGVLRQTEVYRPHLVLWRFAAQPGVLFDGQPRAAQPVAAAAVQALGRTANGYGTRPDRLFTALTGQWATDPADAIFVVVLTDGEVTDPEAMGPAVAALAAEPRLAMVWLVGVTADARASLAAGVYAPLGGRLKVTGLSEPDVQAGLQGLMRAVRGEVWR